MGNTLTYENDDKANFNKNESNLILPLTRSFSDLDLSSSVNSRVTSFQGISNQFIDDHVSDILGKISSRIATTCGVVYYLSEVGSTEGEDNYSEFEILKSLSDVNYIFESLDNKEEKSKCENHVSKMKSSNLVPTTKDNFLDNLTYGIGYELESRESSENLESILENKSKIDDENVNSDRNLYNNCKIKGIEVKNKIFKIFGSKKNHMPFLSPGIIDVFLPFIMDKTLIACFLVCPHWLLTIVNFLNKKYGCSIDKKFVECYSENIELEHATVTIQPVLTVGGNVRIDRVLYAKVLKGCENKSSTLSYSYKYNFGLAERIENISFGNRTSPIFQPNSKTNSGISFPEAAYTSSYRFETRALGTKRVQWAYKDISRSHCEEVVVAHTTTTSSLNVGDRIEIAINMSNSFGIVDLDSIKFQKLIFEEINSERCEIEDMYSSYSDWRLLSGNKSEFKDLSIVPNFLPQMELLSAEYAGTDIVTYKITYKAAQPGELMNSKEHFGIDISIVPRNFAIISALKRKGLQHDRYSPLQLRVGDQLILYISKGGTIPT